ncbi:hypothetical protein, partial [Rhizobium johnstonii]|uniref:hypothetical protein n=1 Tax=Rhizobium johnstonii TaxID=3019933 RepID=UPI003F99A64C
MKFGGFTYEDDDDRNDDKKKSAASTRGDFTPSYDMKGTGYVGGQSRKEEEEKAYVLAYGDQTMPKEGRQAREGRIRVQEEAKAYESSERQQPQQEQRQGRDPFDTQNARKRQDDLSAKLRGRMDAMESAGLQQFGERKDFDNQKQFDTAKKSYQATKEQIKQGKFAGMADRADAAAGDNQQHGQSAGMSSSSRGFAGMADRADAAVKSANDHEIGKGTKKDTG